MSFAYNAAKLLRVIRGSEFNLSSFVFTDSLGMELSHRGNLINLSMIKDMVQGQHDTYRKFLREKVFFDQPIPPELDPEIDIDALVDNTQCRNMGYTFLDDACNDLTKYQDTYGTWLLSDSSRRDRFAYWNGSALVWKPDACLGLLEIFRRCEFELAPGLIFSAGPSARGTEFGRMLLREMPGAPRNLGIVLHNVSFNSTQDKTSHQRLIDHFVPHVPTREWALSLLRYLVIIRPFAIRLVEALFAHEPKVVIRYRHYLWPGIKQTMSSEELGHQLGRVTEKYLGNKYKIKFWRSLTTAILQYDEGDEISDIQKQYYFDTVNMHSSSTANARYAGNTGNMLGADSRVIAGCVRACISWQKRIGLVKSNAVLDKAGNDSSSNVTKPGMHYLNCDSCWLNLFSVQTSLIIKQMKAFQDEALANIRATTTESMAEASRIYFPPPPPPTGSNALRPISDVIVHPSRLEMFRKFLGKPTAHWSCPEQGVLLEHLILGKENILAILGTGAGKTTLVMFLAKMFAKGRLTVVVLPLAPLHSDFHERAAEFGLIASKWDVGGKFNSHAHVVTAAIEDLKHQHFIECVVIYQVFKFSNKFLRSFVMQTANEKRLYRIVFDEIHKIVTDIDYRDVFHLFPRLNLAGVSIFAPSASVPQHLVSAIFELTKTHWRAIRTPSNRKELAYEIRVVPKHLSLTLQVVDYWTSVSLTYMPKDRCLIYCRSINQAKKLGEVLGVLPFHSECDSDEPIKNFRGGTQKILPTTVRLGCGFHYAHIRDVIHCDLPYSVIDHYQEVSRGGRDGRPCRAVTFVAEGRPCPIDKATYDLGTQAIWEWSEKRDQCLRIILSSFLDGVAITCDLLFDAERCDFCKKECLKESPHMPGLLLNQPFARAPNAPLVPTLTTIPGNPLNTQSTMHPKIPFQPPVSFPPAQRLQNYSSSSGNSLSPLTAQPPRQRDSNANLNKRGLNESSTQDKVAPQLQRKRPRITNGDDLLLEDLQ